MNKPKYSSLNFFITATTVLGGSVCPISAAETNSGQTIFAEQCAHCHGPQGQGSEDGFDGPLYGDHSIEVLTQIIDRTMPEDDPELCAGAQARAVAEYIHGEFYSPQARYGKGLVPFPRVALARLTVSQYRNAIADLLGYFTPRLKGLEDDFASPDSLERGLVAEYYQSKGMSKANELVEKRVDRYLDFDYGESSPAEGITAEQFAIIWSGSFVADQTGFYEFRIRSPNGARLYLNNDPPRRRRRRLRDDSSVAGQSALIDAWVSSSKMRESSARVYLLGGRRYPIRLEFFKFKEPRASIRLEFKPPSGTFSVLDARFTRTAPAPRTFVVETPFPADDHSYGYERGNSVSPEWHAATNKAASATAAEVVNRLPFLADLGESKTTRADLHRDFVARFAHAAFGRPLTKEEDSLLRERLFALAASPEAAVRLAVLFTLSSPHFLYADGATPEELATAAPQHLVAKRLALFLWDSIPDRQLLAAADAGELDSLQQIESHARRMLDNPRSRAKIQGFLHHWLQVDERDLAKDRQTYPFFDDVIIADLRYSLDAFVERVVWSESSDYRELLTADYLMLNQRLRDLYRVIDPVELGQSAASVAEGDATDRQESVLDTALANTRFEPTRFAAERRAGVLTHPYLLSAMAYHNTTSPIHRGVFLTRKLVGRTLRPPPVAVAFENEKFASSLTMREKISQLTREPSCASCHSIINPLGFALENFDAIGRWRRLDNGKPIDSRAEYVTLTGESLEVQNARDIADFVVQSPHAHRAFVMQLFEHMVKQNPTAYGINAVSELANGFAEDGFNMQNLMLRIAVRAATHETRFHPTPSSNL